MKGKICIAFAILLTCTSTLSILHKEPNVGAAMSTEEIVFGFSSYDPNEAWYGNPEGMLYDAECYYAWTFINGDVELLDSNTCPDISGTITKVELGLTGFYIGAYRNIILRPIFSGVEGENYSLRVPQGLPGGWTGWHNIILDENAPANWTFDDVAALDCKVIASYGSGSFILFCRGVKIRVTYWT